MRTELYTFLQHVHTLREQLAQWHAQNAQPDSAEPYIFRPLPKDLPLQREVDRDFNLLVDNCDRLKMCIEALPNITLVFISEATALEIHTHDAAESRIIINFSVGEPFVDVWVYGTVADQLLHQISDCIHTCDLLPITDTERQELEAMHSYHDVFP